MGLWDVYRSPLASTVSCHAMISMTSPVQHQARVSLCVMTPRDGWKETRHRTAQVLKLLHNTNWTITCHMCTIAKILYEVCLSQPFRSSKLLIFIKRHTLKNIIYYRYSISILKTSQGSPTLPIVFFFLKISIIYSPI